MFAPTVRSAGSAVNIATLARIEIIRPRDSGIEQVLVDLVEQGLRELRCAGGERRLGGSDQPGVLARPVGSQR